MAREAAERVGGDLLNFAVVDETGKGESLLFPRSKSSAPVSLLAAGVRWDRREKRGGG